MNYRMLGRTGVRISEISIGGWLTFGNAVEDARAREILARAFDAGINFVDTANVYAQGRCEEFLGAALKVRPRESYVLGTKVFFPVGDGPNDRGLSRKHITEQCHLSLRRLNTSYIDLYQCHRYDDETPLEETVRAMTDLVRQGKILYWGVSEWTAEQIQACIEICEDGGYEAPASNQPQYNLLARGIEGGVMDSCTRGGMGIVVWSPLAQGLLTGKYKPGSALPADSRAADPRQNYFIKAKAQDRALLERVQRFAAVATEAGMTPSQLALAWILRHDAITSCIVGATRTAQLEENCRASGRRLDPGIVERVEAIFRGPAA